jgi:hypothetical protein
MQQRVWHNAIHINRKIIKIMQALFLGAGASFDCGLPLTWELTAEIQRWLTPERLAAYNAGWEEQGVHWNERVIARINELVADEDRDYEQVLQILARESQTAAYEFLQRDYHQAYCFYAQIVYAFLLERQARNYNFTSVVLKDYDSLKNLMELNRPLWIFSTNQDVVVELLAARLGVPLKCGVRNTKTITIGDGSVTRDIQFEELRVDAAAPEPDFFSAGEYGINLVKLYGGLDMFLAEDGRSLLKLKPDAQRPSEYIADLVFINQVNQALALKQNGVVTNRSLYQDSEGKLQWLERSLIAGYQHLPQEQSACFPDAFRLMEQVLPELEEVIVIGSRLENSVISGMLANWVSDSRRRLLVVDPAHRDLPRALEESEGNIRPLRQGVTEFFLGLDQRSNIYTSLLRNFQRNMRRKVRMKLLRSLTLKS